MTVYELLTELSKHPPDMEVFLPTTVNDEGAEVQYTVAAVEEDRGCVILLD